MKIYGVCLPNMGPLPPERRVWIATEDAYSDTNFKKNSVFYIKLHVFSLMNYYTQ